MAFEVLQVKAWVNLPKRSGHQNSFSGGRYQTQSGFQAMRVQTTEAFMGEQQHPRPTASPLGLFLSLSRTTLPKMLLFRFALLLLGMADGRVLKELAEHRQLPARRDGRV